MLPVATNNCFRFGSDRFSSLPQAYFGGQMLVPLLIDESHLQ